MASTACLPEAPQPATHKELVSYFLPEGRACVARRQELGDYVSNPAKAAINYANFAATDAVLRPNRLDLQRLDYDRAKRIAEHMAGLPNGLPGKFARPVLVPELIDELGREMGS